MANQYSPPAGYPHVGTYPPPPAPAATSNPGRPVAVFVLVLLGCLLTAVAPAIVWTRNEVLNSNNFVTTMAPAGRNPGVQAAVIAAVDQPIDAALSRSAVLGVVGGTAAAQGLVNGAVASYVHGSAFPPLWDQLIRNAHDQLVGALTGKSAASGAVQVNDRGTVILNLAPIVDQIKQNLTVDGLSIGGLLPSVTASFQIAQLQSFAQAQTLARWLDPAATWLPWIALLSFALALVIARRRLRTLLAIGFGVATSTVLVAGLVLIARMRSISDVPASVLPHATAIYLYDTVIHGLVVYLAVVFAAGAALVIAAGLALAARTYRPGRRLRPARTQPLPSRGLLPQDVWVRP